MIATPQSLSRRAFFRRLVPTKPPATARTAAPAPATLAASPLPTVPPLAVIAGRHCLAYRNSFCSVCRERCPVTDAIIVERGVPRIDPARCNGCRICHDVCPAPVNAIRLIARPTATAPH